MSKKPNKIVQIIDQLTRGLGFLGQLALASMVLTICYDVIMRYGFKSPTLWSLEINTFLVLFVTLIPAGDVLMSDSHLRITYFTDKLGLKTRKFVGMAGSLLGCLFSSVMIWKGLTMAMTAYRYDERMSTPLGTPMFIPYFFIPLGFFFLFLQYVLRMNRDRSTPEESLPEESR